MTSTYKRTPNRGSYGFTVLQDALKRVDEGAALKTIAKDMDARRNFCGGGGSGKLKKGPPTEIKVAIKKFPYGEKAPHMVKKAPHKEKYVADKAPIMEKSSQKAPPP